MPSSSRSSLLLITRDPFLPWKTTEIILSEAHDRGFETLVVMDDRTSISDWGRLTEFADAVIPWKSKGYCEGAFNLATKCKSDFVLRVDDDEIPSAPLWEFAANPPSPSRFGIPVLPVIGDHLYQPDVGIQERLFWRDGYRFHGDISGDSEGAPRVVLSQNPGIVIWHFLLEAPRAEREEKAARYASLAPGEHRSRLIYEEHPEGLVPIPLHLRRLLPEVSHA